jgi:hypothetical protein
MKINLDHNDPVNRGHWWLPDKYSGAPEVDKDEIWENHTGPKCMRCYYSYCQYCADGPQEDCTFIDQLELFP